MAEQQVTTTNPTYPDYIRQMMERVATDSNQLYDTGGQQFFRGDTVADFNPTQIQGQQGLGQALTNTAAGGIRSNIQGAVDANNRFLGANYLTDLNATPGYAGIREGILRDTGRQLSESYLPSVRSDALGSGMFGGSRAQIGEALMGARSADEISRNLSGLDAGIYGQNLQAQQNAINRTGQLTDLQQSPDRALIDLGGQTQTQAQNEITGQRERWDFNQNRPYQNLQTLQGAYGSYPMGQTSTTSMSAPQESNPNAAQTIGGALLGTAGTWGPAVYDWWKNRKAPPAAAPGQIGVQAPTDAIGGVKPPVFQYP